MGNCKYVRANSAVTGAVLKTLTETAAGIRNDRAKIAGLLAGATGISQDVWARALARDPFEVTPMNDDLVRSQQKVADRFRALGLLPVEIKVADIIWHAGV
jgi:sulfonate transport system substrate-binding protein